MYYLAYSKLNNQLVFLSATEIPANELLVIEARDGDAPDLSRWLWNGSILDFQKREDGRVLEHLPFMGRFTPTELGGNLYRCQAERGG